MIFLTSLAALLILGLVVVSVGRQLVAFMPFSSDNNIKFYIGPLLGLAVLVLATTLYGWFLPFRPLMSLALYSTLVVGGIFLDRNRVELIKDWGKVSAFTVLVSLPILIPLLWFNSFNPFNDTFTYLVHGQWLQLHAFSEIAKGSGNFPSETQVALYQSNGLRMGASFFLGFMQSLFNLEWSYYIYLATVGLVFGLGCLALGAIVQQIIPISNLLCMVLVAIPSYSMNGFLFGAQYGFFPQTFGLAFSVGIVALLPLVINAAINSARSWKDRLIYILPLSICSAAFLLTYSDMAIALGAGISLFILLSILLNWSHKGAILFSIGVLVVQTGLLVNVEGLRIFRSFLHTAMQAATGSLQIGWPVLWTPVQFLAYTFGFKTSFQSDTFLLDWLISCWLFLPVLVVMGYCIWKVFKVVGHKPGANRLALILILSINFVFFLGFLKFRYLSPNIDGGVGNTFLQFKLAKWVSPFNLCLLAVALAWIYTNIKKYRAYLISLFFCLISLVLYIQLWFIPKMYITQLQHETMRNYSSFDTFLDLRSRVSSIPKGDVIYLGIPNEHHKLTQMVAYVLWDRKLAGKYEDGYLQGSIPVNERDMPIESTQWMIELNQQKYLPPGQNPLYYSSPFSIHRAPYSFFNFKGSKGGYGTERSEGKEWNWVKESISYGYLSIGSVTSAKLTFEYVGNPGVLSVDIKNSSGKNIKEFTIQLNGGWGKFESPPFELNSKEILVVIEANGAPVKLSAGDTREVQFLIQNLTLSPANSN